MLLPMVLMQMLLLRQAWIPLVLMLLMAPPRRAPPRAGRALALIEWALEHTQRRLMRVQG